MTRERRTKMQVTQLDTQIYDVLSEDYPQSVRHVFYRMTDPRLPEPVEKSEGGYKQVQHRLAELREAGVVPFSWITDGSRSAMRHTRYSGVDDFAQEAANLYRLDYWRDKPTRLEVWCESRSISAVLWPTCSDYGVNLFPAGGFASVSFIYQAAKQTIYSGKAELVVLYIGDYDPAGVMIDRDIEGKMRRYMARINEEDALDVGIEFTFTRLAINEAQIAAYDLPTKPRKATETRRPDIASTVEAEAMPAAQMRDLLTESIEGYIDPRELSALKVAEHSERAGIQALLAGAVEPF